MNRLLPKAAGNKPALRWLLTHCLLVNHSTNALTPPEIFNQLYQSTNQQAEDQNTGVIGAAEDLHNTIHRISEGQYGVTSSQNQACGEDGQQQRNGYFPTPNGINDGHHRWQDT